MGGRGREVRRFVQTRYMRDRYMRMVELLRRWVRDRLRQRLLNAHALIAIGNRIIGHHWPDDTRRRRRRGRLYRRFRVSKLIRHAVVVAVDDRPLLGLRRGTKGVLEGSNEGRLRRRRRTRRGDGGHRRGRDRGVGRRARRRRCRVFAPRRVDVVGQRGRLAG